MGRVVTYLDSVLIMPITALCCRRIKLMKRTYIMVMAPVYGMSIAT